MSYTALAVISVLVVLALEFTIIRSRLLHQNTFYFAYAIVLFFQLLTNGYLTKNNIVIYDPTAILGIRIAFAPVEDLLFGFSLVFLSMALWVKATKNANR